MIESEKSMTIDFSMLSKYEVPKHVFHIPEIPRTESGKPDRIRTEIMISDMLSD